jgi:primosomal protein N' (replication factor Y)
MLKAPPYCKVALPLPLKEAFDYSLPEGMPALPGMRVRVPFGKRKMTGVLVELAAETALKSTKAVEALLDAEVMASPRMLEFTRWVAEYYLAGWGEVLPLAFPPYVKGKRRKKKEERAEKLPKASRAPDLSPAQAAAAKALRQGIKEGKGAAFLLHGVTGSGKTEVYLDALEAALESGGGAIVLVPEIALTPQTMARFESRFPGQVALIHSALTDIERGRSFEALRSRKARVALGARSALFAPVPELKLIVVDEESEPSYKQENAPRYHARDAALVRAQMEGAVALLGSATPSFESYHNAKSGKLKLLELPGRVTGSAMPAFEFVDLSKAVDKAAPDDAISPRLGEALRENRKAGEQSLLFLNRRGFAPVMACVKCGESIQCPHCSISLTYHKDGGAGASLRCHLCGHNRRPPSACPNPKCGFKLLKLLGTGTQRLEEELRRELPGVRALRVDRDTATGADFHAELGKLVHGGELDLLLGTQMIAKGLDFPNLTLVGVINADTALSFPDFRAEERSYQLLVQVAGRAGRAEKEGRVIVQTRQPEHPCLQAAARQDFKAFFEERISERKDLGYPPFGRLAALVLRSQDKAAAMEAASTLASALEKKKQELKDPGLLVLGPAPAPLVQVKGWWRYRLLAKAPLSRSLHAWLDPLVFEHKPKNAYLAVDVDPLNFL